MQYQEKKTEEGYEYRLDTDDGHIAFKSNDRLSPDHLDTLTMSILKSRKSSGTIAGVRFEHESGGTWSGGNEVTVSGAQHWTHISPVVAIGAIIVVCFIAFMFVAGAMIDTQHEKDRLFGPYSDDPTRHIIEVRADY